MNGPALKKGVTRGRLAGHGGAGRVLESLSATSRKLLRRADQGARRQTAVSLAKLEDQATGRVAQPRSRLDDRLEDALWIGRRGRDYAEDLGGGGLLLQRPGEVGGALLQLLEEAGVLDGDDRLIRERLEEGDLALVERPRLVASQADRADGDAISQQRRVEEHPGSERLDVWELGANRFVVDVGDVYQRSVEDRAADRPGPDQGLGLADRHDGPLPCRRDRPVGRRRRPG